MSAATWRTSTEQRAGHGRRRNVVDWIGVVWRSDAASRPVRLHETRLRTSQAQAQADADACRDILLAAASAAEVRAWRP